MLYKARVDRSSTESLKLKEIKSRRLLLPAVSMHWPRFRRHVEV
jgi:hypothetical protein